jgi:GT2 family glycosyltransferase
MPVHDGSAFLGESLAALLAQVDKGLLEVLVVDDASGDGSAELAADLGARVLRAPVRGGPGLARNLGAEAARGDVLFFVDADVVVHGDAARRVAETLADPDVAAVFGSYDDRPRDTGFASRYMNLRHHLVHQQGAGEAETFWAGCGAVRRQVFLAVGGFDAARYPEPSIEDIELGGRLRGAGHRIRLHAGLQGTHLKRWTLRGVIHTDIFRRAIPWARLLLADSRAVRVLNTSRRERARAGLAWLILAAAGLSAGNVLPLWAPLGLLGVAALLNRPLLSLFARRGGWLFAVAGLLQHQLYYLYSSAVYVFCFAESRLRDRPAAASR